MIDLVFSSLGFASDDFAGRDTAVGRLSLNLLANSPKLDIVTAQPGDPCKEYPWICGTFVMLFCVLLQKNKKRKLKKSCLFE